MPTRSPFSGCLPALMTPVDNDGQPDVTAQMWTPEPTPTKNGMAAHIDRVRYQ